MGFQKTERAHKIWNWVVYCGGYWWYEGMVIKNEHDK